MLIQLTVENVGEFILVNSDMIVTILPRVVSHGNGTSMPDTYSTEAGSYVELVDGKTYTVLESPQTIKRALFMMEEDGTCKDHKKGKGSCCKEHKSVAT